MCQEEIRTTFEARDVGERKLRVRASQRRHRPVASGDGDVPLVVRPAMAEEIRHGVER